MHEYKLQQGLVTPRPNRCDFYAQTIRPTSSLSLASLLGSSSCHMLQRLSHQLLPAEMDRSTQPQSREGGVQPYGFGRAAGSYDPLVRFFLFLVNLRQSKVVTYAVVPWSLGTCWWHHSLTSSMSTESLSSSLLSLFSLS